MGTSERKSEYLRTGPIDSGYASKSSKIAAHQIHARDCFFGSSLMPSFSGSIDNANSVGPKNCNARCVSAFVANTWAISREPNMGDLVSSLGAASHMMRPFDAVALTT